MRADSPAALAFVTGATGFIGGRLARALDARGYRLRCLVRAPERAGALAGMGAELIVGDVADERVMQRALQGADVAFHLAGSYDLGRVDELVMMQVNVAGTCAFLNAVRHSVVSRAVYTSTTAALGPVSAGEGDEESRYEGPFPSVYHRTKTEAHQLARQAQAEGLPLVIVCPSVVYGPGDAGPTGRYLQDLLRHRVPGLSTKPAWFSYVHVDDVVDGMIAAAERGRTGATYVLSGEHASVNRFTHMLVELAGTWASPLRFPPFAIRLTGRALDALGRLLHARMPISRELAEVAATGTRWVHSHVRATAELGYRPRALAEGLPETVRDAQVQLAR